MTRQTFAEVLGRVRVLRECSLEALRDLAPTAYRDTHAWDITLLRNVIAPLAQMGLLHVRKGFVTLAESEVSLQRVDLSDIKLQLSAAAAALEDILGYDFWRPQESIFGPPTAGNWPQIFVLMPFHESLRPVFEDHITNVARRLKMTVGRADDFFSPTSVVHEIWSAICAAQVVLADCTGRNPNVFYEVGLAHAIGRSTILIAQGIDDVPFDLRHLRVIVYNYTPRGMQKFEKQLTATLRSLR